MSNENATQMEIRFCCDSIEDDLMSMERNGFGKDSLGDMLIGFILKRSRQLRALRDTLSDHDSRFVVELIESKRNQSAEIESLKAEVSRLSKMLVSFDCDVKPCGNCGKLFETCDVPFVGAEESENRRCDTCCPAEMANAAYEERCLADQESNYNASR